MYNREKTSAIARLHESTRKANLYRLNRLNQKYRAKRTNAMYVQDLKAVRRSKIHSQSIIDQLLSISSFTLLCLFSLLLTQYSCSARATEKPNVSRPIEHTVFSPSLIFQLNKTEIDSRLLESYLETNFSGVSPTAEQAHNPYSNFWQPLSGHSKAIFGDKKAHWFRLKLHNPSNHTKNYILSVAPTRGLYVKSLTLPLANENEPAIKNTANSDKKLVMTTFFDRKTDIVKKANIPLSFAAYEIKIVLISMASDNWTLPHFALKTAEQITADKNYEEKFWHLINGIFIGMTFFIFIGAVITKQGGLLWLPFYSISTLCFLPGYLNYNLQHFDISAERINTLNIELCIISLIAFLGLLKYIFSSNTLLQKTRQSNLLLILSCLLVIINFFTPPKIDMIVYTAQIIEIIIALLLSAQAFRKRQTSAYLMVVPAKLIVFFVILFILYQASMGVMSEYELFTWLASLILIDTAILAIILFMIDRYQRESTLLKLIASIKKEQQVAAISPMLGKNRHDLRASLSDIIGLSELIVASPLDQEQRKHILDIQQSGRKGLEKINSIFSYKNNHSSLLQNQEPFTLSMLISECAQYYGYRANELNKEVIVDIPERTPEYWKGKHEKIRQLFMHIFEFFLAENDFNEIRVSVPEFNKTTFTIVFLITLDNADLGANNKIIRKLATAKLISERIGGSLSLKETKNSLLITVTILATPTDNQSREQLDLELLKNRRVIIIDDSETSCNVIESYLQRWDVLTFKAHNFNDALAIIHHQNNIGQAIDVALIDYVMPNINGIEVAQCLRADLEVPDSLSIIIMSNTASSISPTDTKNLGIRQVLDKPVLAHTLRLVLLEEFYLLKSFKEEDIRGDHLNKTTKKLLLVEDNPVSAKIVCSMLKRLMIDYEHASSSQEALEKITLNNFDIILMDCELPDESGFAATRKIRAFEKSRKPQQLPIFIVALTAHDDAESKHESVEAGMDDYFPKPISLIQLRSLIDNS